LGKGQGFWGEKNGGIRGTGGGPKAVPAPCTDGHSRAACPRDIGKGRLEDVAARGKERGDARFFALGPGENGPLAEKKTAQ